MAVKVLIAPGIQNSGPNHWQTLWEKENSDFKRVQHREWEYPECWDWVKKIEEEIILAGEDTVVAAHSLSCLAIVHWAKQTKLKIKGALLVAPPDVDNPNFPKEATGFSPIPLLRLPFPSIIMASTNDPYMTIEQCEFFAKNWGSELINIGEKGHINSASNLGSWDEGKRYLQKLING